MLIIDDSQRVIEYMYARSKTIETKTGLLQVRTYKSPIPPKHRGKKAHKTLPSQAARNSKLSFLACYNLVINNFTPSDLCITLTFCDSLDAETLKKRIKAVVCKMRKLYKDKNEEFRCIYFIGRGDDADKLHLHMLCNVMKYKYYRAYIINGAARKGMNIDIQTIKQYSRDSSIQIMESTVYYLYAHYESLTDEDKSEIKHTYHRTRNLDMPQIEIDDTSDADKIYKALSKVVRKGKDIDAFVERYYPDYKFYRYGCGRTQNFFWQTDYGSGFDFTLIRKGSDLDNIGSKHKTIIKFGYTIDTVTGEVYSA